MVRGTVKWFDDKKGYGFIVPDDASEDCLVHYTAIKEEGLMTLRSGEKVEFEIIQGKKGRQAGNVVKLQS